MNKTNNYTSISVSSKGRVLLHIHESELFIFYCNCKYKKFYGYEVKIKTPICTALLKNLI